MEAKNHRSGKSSGFQYEKLRNQARGNYNPEETDNLKITDEDLIIEDNTIYEIDRDCYERSRRQKKRRE